MYYAGTAGVWRMQAIVESGGWDDRITAEDMDLALRTGLLGWKFLFASSIKVIIHQFEDSSGKTPTFVIILICFKLTG